MSAWGKRFYWALTTIEHFSRVPLNPHGKPPATATFHRWGTGTGSSGTCVLSVVRGQALNPGSQTPRPRCHPLCGPGGQLMNTVHQKRTVNRQMKEEVCETCEDSFVNQNVLQLFSLCVSKEPPWTPRSSGRGWFMGICSTLPAG